MDVQGICRSHGAEYDRPNGKFKYRCNSGIEDTVACLGSKRANNKWINVGERLVVDGFWYACECQPSGSIMYAEEPSCAYYGDNRLHVGEEIRDFLKLKCTEDGFVFVGCYYKDQQGNEHNLQKGEKKVVTDAEITCEEGNSSIRFRPAPQDPKSTSSKFDRVFAHGVAVTNP
ncbi:hypothetical protein AAVH_11269 [Aphelenchoides avenae]|nr:hypothetical protein AAVH_11269 [Aphelenchus avenae]